MYQFNLLNPFIKSGYMDSLSLAYYFWVSFYRLDCFIAFGQKETN